MNITFDEENHIYKADNKFIPSVTMILKANGLMDGLKFVDSDVLQRACEFGTHVHSTTELYDRGCLNEKTLDPALIPYLDGWKAFLKDTGFEVLALEEQVISMKHWYAGRFDKLGIMPKYKGRTLVEIKTGASYSHASALQTGAYEYAYNESAPLKEHIRNRFVVHLGEGTYKIYPCADRNDVYTFFGCLNVYNFKLKNNLIKQRG